VGKGSTFEIRLPLSAGAPAAEVAASSAGPVRRRILVIDDNRDAADSLALMLRADGHEVRAGFSAEDALALARDWRPEVLLLDIGLPVMDGYEVARRLRADAPTAGLRLVALTGYGQPQDIQRSAAAGFDAHLVKPVSLQALAEAIAPAGKRDT
jgi:CheY-like chemotaxis protein